MPPADKESNLRQPTLHSETLSKGRKKEGRKGRKKGERKKPISHLVRFTLSDL